MPLFRFTVHPSQQGIEVIADDKEKALAMAQGQVDLELQEVRNKEGKCNKCQNEHEDSLLFWHGDVGEDYDMGEYDCLCERCLFDLNQEGKIKWVK